MSSTTCPRCRAKSPVRLGPNQACAACASRFAWSRWQEQGKLVIDSAAIEASEARRAGVERTAVLREVLVVLASFTAAVLGAAAVWLVTRIWAARSLGSLETLVGDVRSAAARAAAFGALCFLGSLLALRLRAVRFRPVLVGLRLSGVVAGAAGVIVGLLCLASWRGPSGFEHLSMPPLPDVDALQPQAARAIRATAVIVAPDADGDAKSPTLGTSVVVGADQGRAFLLTCSHVAMPYVAVGARRDAETARPVWVEFADGRQASGSVVWTAGPPLDVALVEVNIVDPPEPITLLASAEGIQAEEPVFFIPNPLRHGFRVERGKVLRREAHDTPLGRFNLLFTSLPVQHGDSGSALLDARGRLVGLNTWTKLGAVDPLGISLPAEAAAEIAEAMRLRGAETPPSGPPLAHALESPQ